MSSTDHARRQRPVRDRPATLGAAALALIALAYVVVTPTNVLLAPAAAGSLLGVAYFADDLHRDAHAGEWFTPSRFGLSLAEEVLALSTAAALLGWLLLFLLGIALLAVPAGLLALPAWAVCWWRL